MISIHYKKKINGHRTPKLRFSEFNNPWEINKISDLFSRVPKRVEVDILKYYQEIGIRSHGKGLFHKNLILGKTLGDKRVFWVEEDVLILNIVFAWEQAVARTTLKEKGMIASHRFPQYKPITKKSDTDFMLWFFLTKEGKNLLEIASPGGAGRNKTLGQKSFDELIIIHPTFLEQKKIANFLLAVERKIELLTRKKELLELYKKGVMQNIFSQEIRFKDENGNNFPDWEEKRLGEIGNFKNGLNKDKNDYGFGYPHINLMDVFGKNEITYKVFDRVNANQTELLTYDMKKGDVLFIRSSVKRSGVGEAAIITMDLINTVYSGFLIRFRENKNILDLKFKRYCFSIASFRKELLSYATSSANTNINQESLSLVKVNFPSMGEQKEIASFLSKLDIKIDSVENQIKKTKEFKKGLLQQMFI